MAFSNTISVTGNAAFSNTIAVTGNATLSNTIAVTGAANLASTLGVVGAVVLSNTLGVTGAATFSNTTAHTGSATFSNTIGVTGAATFSNTMSVTGDATFASNAAFHTDLLFLDGTNNRIGLKNNAPSSVDLVTVGGNVAFNAANTTGLRFITATASVNSAIVLMANTSNSRLTFTTYDNSNTTVNDGGFLFNFVNSTATTAGILFTSNTFYYKGANVTHAGNFGIYNVSGTRVGP